MCNNNELFKVGHTACVSQPKISFLKKQTKTKPTLSQLERELHLVPPRAEVPKHPYRILKAVLQSWTVAAIALAFPDQLFRADPQRMNQGMRCPWDVGMPRKIRREDWFDAG